MHDFFKNTAAFFDRKFFFGLLRYGIFLLVVVGVSSAARKMKVFMAFDRDMLARAAFFRTEALTVVMRTITFLGGAEFVLVCAAIILVLFTRKKRAIHFAAFSFSVGGAAAIVVLLKWLFGRIRPNMEPLVTETGFSFPSGHVILALAFWGMLIYFLIYSVRFRRMKGLFFFAGACIIALISFSRIYLGAHWPTDVVASFFIGSAWLFFIITQTKEKLNMPSGSLAE